MNQKCKIIFLLFVSLIFGFSVRAQTLYWIGGSGNFNDANHWSLTSGGKAIKIAPTNNTDVVFDDLSGKGSLIINFVGVNYSRSFYSSSVDLPITFIGSKYTEMHISGNYELNSKANFIGNTNLFFNSGLSLYNIIRFNASQYDGDVLFQNGNWDLRNISTGNLSTINFVSGSYKLNNALLKTGNLISNSTTVNFEVNQGVIDVFNELTIGGKTHFNSNKLYIKSNQSDLKKFKVEQNVSFGNNYKLLNSNTSAACGATLSSIGISCSGSCDGKLILTIDVTCAPAPFTLLWSNPSCPTPTLTGVGPGTYTISNLCGCIDQFNVIVFDNSGTLLAVSNSTGIAGTSAINFIPVGFVQPTCNGLCNGSITGNLSGSSPPYTVTVNGGASGTFAVGAGSTTYTNLCGGTNTFAIVDSKGCTRTFTPNLVQPAALALNAATSSITCNGICNGSVSISPTGGTASYTVNFTPGGTFTVPAAGTASLINLCPSAISATVTDSKNCSLTTNFNITQPPPLLVVPSQTALTCFGVCNGAASVAVSGGTSPYTYTWSPGPANTPGILNLCAGPQTITVKDNNQCTSINTLTITQPASVTITPTITNIACNGLCNGSASVSASGGTGPITFTWVAAGPSTISTTSTIAGQCAGTYTIFAKDGNACTTSAVITITQPPALTITAVTQSVQCFGQCTGASTANVSGGTAPYTYTWSPGAPTGQGTAIVSNLCAGNYTVSVKDASNCPINLNISIIQSSSITPIITTTSITCNGLCNGVISPTASGGLAPYTFTLITPSAATITSAPPFSGLCAGTYTVLIKDLSTCVQSQTVTVAQPNPLVVSVNSTSLNCFNVCNGSLAGSVLGGTPTYTLLWNTPTGTVSGGIISGLCAGSYTFMATDFNGCTTSSVVVLAQPPQLTATINVTNPTCNSLCNGVANAGVGGGTPGYTLNWSNGFTGNPNPGLCAGVYTLTVNDSKGCNKAFTTTLTAPPPITITVNTSSTSCAGSCNGSATVSAIGGSPGFIYQFNTLPLPTTNTTGILGGFCAGGYIVSATDVNGCSQSIPFTINQPIALSVALTGLQTSCNACSGAATVTASNGTPTYAIVWTNSLSATVSSNSVASGLCIGNYTATATDSKGCIATTTVSIAQTVSVTVATGGGSIQCFGACTASATANAVGGTGAYSYTWAVTVQTTQTAVNLCAGNYTVTVADALGCINSGTISFVNPPDIIIAPTKTNVACFGNCNGAINSNASGGTGALTYSWSPGGQTTTNLTSLCAGTYTLKVTDANGCNKTQIITITQSPSITATFTTTNPSACTTNNGSICATPSGGSGAGYTFTWSPAGGLGINTSCYSLLNAGSYSLVVSDGAGCTTTLSSLLTNPTGPTLTINSQSVACFGGNTGAISVTATGVPGAFTFTWTPVVGFTTIGNTSSASSLVSGNYVISVTDANGCITSQSVAVTQATSLTVNSVVTNIKCNSVCNGSITLVTAGATPGYTYSWLPAPSITTGQGTSTVSNLCAGSYSVNITDANACIKTVVFNVIQPVALTITTTPSNVKCFGLCNGSITALASGGTGVINYSWPPNAPFTGSITATIFNLCPNIYTVNATDANLCTITKTVQITQPPALTSTLNLVNASCSNSCNAVATNTVVGGTPTYTFSWSSSGATTSTLGNLCAGNYTATVTDGNGCVSANGFTVVAPAPFTTTLTPFNPLCNAACNGSITTVLSGAQGAVTFNWLPVGAGQNPSGLCPNNYTLTATDAAGCQLVSTTNLTQPLALLANVTTTNPACNGNCNGVAISTPANAQGAVNYTWTPAAPNSATINSLCAGNYSVLVQDANGCQDVQTFTLTNPPVLNVNPSISPATCGVSNGSITVVAVGGTPSYSYTWAAPVVSTSSAVAGLAAGVYTVVVTDSKNCTNTVTIPLSNSNGPNTAPIISTSISCNGLCTGAASINIASILGGTPGYTVGWVSPPSPSPINPQINLCAGVYTAQVTDANACILFTAVTIAQPAAISILPNVGLPTCNGICNGSISLNPSGGVGPYSYTWTPVAPNSATLLNACAGNYTILIGNNGCPAVTQTLNLPSILNILSTTASTNNTCFSNCNGALNITSISGGSPPYSTNWSTGQSTSLISSLCNGNYSVNITDVNGCFNTFTSSISSPSQITAITAISSPSCGLCNGSSTVTAAGGVAPFTYSWTTGTTGPITNSLCAGLYQVLVTDASGCNQLQNVAISNSNGITGQLFNTINEQCAGTCNGASTVIPIGGTAPITFSWTSPVSTNSAVAGLCAGTYFVQMTDAQGCIRTASTSVTAATSITLSPFVTQPSCGLSNGTINVIASGGTPAYSYTWVPVAGSTSSLTNVGVGNYSITVSDFNGCIKTQAFAISNANGPVVTFTQTNINCFNACTGSITALGTSTSNPVTYSWSTGSTAQTVTSLCKGVVTLTVTAANGCKTVKSFTLTDNPSLQLSLSNIQQPKCNNNCNGAITLVPSGGTLPYVYSWTPLGSTNPLTGLCSGSYVGTVTDSKGCVLSETVILSNPPLIVVTPTLINSSCSTVADGSASLTVTGGSPAFTYTWSGPAAFTSTNQNITNVLSGTYSLNLTDTRGCVVTNTFNIVPTITITANAGPDATVCPTSSVILTGTNSIGAITYNWYLLPNNINPIANTSTLVLPNAAGASTFVLQTVSSVSTCAAFDTVVVNVYTLPLVDAGPSYTIPVFSTVTIGGSPTSPTGITFTWSPSFTLDNGSIPNPTASNTVNTTYTVTVTDMNGCMASDTMQVLLYPEIIIPNGFSPNGDSKNDKWQIDNIEQFPDNTVEVYNRWGEQLFYSKGYAVPFNGQYKGKDLPVGTYYYIINLNHPAYLKAYTGPLTIFR